MQPNNPHPTVQPAVRFVVGVRRAILDFAKSHWFLHCSRSQLAACDSAWPVFSVEQTQNMRLHAQCATRARIPRLQLCPVRAFYSHVTLGEDRIPVSDSAPVSQCPGCTESFEGLGIEREY